MKRHRSKSLIVTLSLIGLLAVSTGCGHAGGSGSAAEIDQLAQAPTQGTSDSTAQSSAAKGDALPDQNNPFPNRAPAPTLDGGVEWLNTSAPIDLKNLRGKFVVLDFWTYCCINCMHILPELKKLEQAYPNNVVVIGVHSGKFDAEHDSENIRQAVMRNDIEHPVVNDADYKIWNHYGCTSWPSLRVIDPEGNVVAEQGGEIEFATLNEFFQKVLPYYRQHHLLDERPVQFDLERDKAAATPLRFPGKILADEPGGRLFIADSNHNRVVVASLDGKLQQVIGSGKIGRTDGDFRTAQFHHPQGMALRGDTLYVADTENHLLRKVDLKTQRVSTIAGTGEQSRFNWPGLDPDAPQVSMPQRFVGPPLSTPLNSPWALCFVGDDLYIAMAGAHQIWKLPLNESEIGPYAGNGREDIVDGPLLPKRPYQAGYASFAQPSGLTTDGTWLYVADSEGSSIRAVPLDPTKDVHTVVGTASLDMNRLFTFGDVDGPLNVARLQHCLDVVYHDGHLYVADTYNDKIKAIDLTGSQCQTLAGTGKAGHVDSGADVSQTASFSEPAGLSYAAGKLFVADTDNHLIRLINLPHNGNSTGNNAGGAQVSTLEITGLNPSVTPATASAK
jgi:sugar lactone lactonase YvrE/thiol-disulfide isomerase/thioredoxin